MRQRANRPEGQAIDHRPYERMSETFDVLGGPDPFDPTANPTSLAYAVVSNQLMHDWSGRISGNVTLGLARNGLARVEAGLGSVLPVLLLAYPRYRRHILVRWGRMRS